MKGNKEGDQSSLRPVFDLISRPVCCATLSQNEAIMLIVMSRRKSIEKCSIATFDWRLLMVQTVAASKIVTAARWICWYHFLMR